MKVQRLLEKINTLAPWELAESWDRVGLQIGDVAQKSKKVMVAVDINQKVIEEGLKLGVDGFLIHHPLLFKPLTQVNTGNYLGKIIQKLLQNNLFLIAAHTNMDKAKEGINQYLAKKLDLTQLKVLAKEKHTSYKIVVFTPEENLFKLRKAMAAAGAGVIGDYGECAFVTRGSGSFMPNEAADPFLGNIGEVNEVPEVKLEMVAEEKSLASVVQAIRENHPYEEAAFDILPKISFAAQGLGRVGTLKEELPLEEVCNQLKTQLAVKQLQVLGKKQKIIRKIAICSGSGGSLVSEALKTKADLFLTGEISYHDYLNCHENQMAVITLGHFSSEKCFVPLVCNYLNSCKKEKEFKDFEAFPSKTEGVELQLI